MGTTAISRYKNIVAAAILALAAIVMTGMAANVGAVTLEEGETIQEAINRAEPGDTVTVPAGEYDETFTIDRTITLVGDEGAILTSSEEVITVESENVTITGFTFTDTSGAIVNSLVDVSGLTISGNIFHDTVNSINLYYAGSGIIIADNLWTGTNTYAATINEISGVTISGNTYEEPIGSFLHVRNASDVTVSEDTISESNSMVFRIGLNTDGLTVENNTIDGAAHIARIGSNSGSPGVLSDNIVFTGNEFTDVAQAGMAFVVVEDDGNPVLVDGGLTLSENRIYDLDGGLAVENRQADSAVLAEINYWGGGAPLVEGNVIAAEWYTNYEMTCTNLAPCPSEDEAVPAEDDEEVVPGVPDTSGINGGIAGYVAAGLAVVSALVGSVVYLRKRA